MYIFSEKEFKEVSPAKSIYLQHLYFEKFFKRRYDKYEIYTVIGIKKNASKNFVLATKGSFSNPDEIRNSKIEIECFSIEQVMKNLFSKETREKLAKYYNTVGRYRYFQPNKVAQEDCTVRALAKIENLTWKEAFRLLADVACEMEMMIHYDCVIESVLCKLGYKCIEAEERQPKTVEVVSGGVSKGMLFVHNHVIAVVDGLYYDSFDSGLEKVEKYFVKL